MACIALCLGSSLNIVFSRFIHIVRDGNSFLIIGTVFHFVKPKFRKLFSFFIIANNCTHLLVWKIHIFGSIRRETLGYRSLRMFSFHRHCKVFQCESTHLHSHQPSMCVPAVPHTHWCCQSLHCSHSDGYSTIPGLWVYSEFPTD